MPNANKVLHYSMNKESNKDSKRDDFLRNLEVEHFAGVGVIFCRTKEGKRANDALREFAELQELPFEHWNCRDGWVKVDSQGDLSMDYMTEPFMAMKSILGGQDPAKPEGIYVMHDLEYGLPSNEPSAPLVRCIKEYVRDFANREYRLVIVVPETYTLPETLMGDVTLMDFDLPSRKELKETLNKVIQSYFVDKNGSPIQYEEPFDESGVSRILNAAAGMTDLEAETNMAKVIVRNDETWPKTDAVKFAEDLMKAKVEMVKRSNILEIIPPLHCDQLGGLDKFKSWLEKRSKALTPEAKAFGVKRPKGCALFGVPGTGKSVGARVVGHIVGAPILRADISRLFGGIVGQTEGNVRSMLKQIEAQAPCIAWIDEIDKAGIDPRGPSGDSGTSSRVIGNLLTFMAESEAEVFWVFTANRTQGLPPELLRKGRLDELFNVAPPNSEERMEIISIHLRARKQDPEAMEGIEMVVAESEGYVGAELEAAVNEAVIVSFSDEVDVTGDLILTQLKSTVPMKDAFSRDFKAMKKWAHNNARPASSHIEGEDTGGKSIEEEVAPAKSGRRVRKRVRKGGVE